MLLQETKDYIDNVLLPSKLDCGSSEKIAYDLFNNIKYEIKCPELFKLTDISKNIVNNYDQFKEYINKSYNKLQHNKWKDTVTFNYIVQEATKKLVSFITNKGYPDDDYRIDKIFIPINNDIAIRALKNSSMAQIVPNIKAGYTTNYSDIHDGSGVAFNIEVVEPANPNDLVMLFDINGNNYYTTLHIK